MRLILTTGYKGRIAIYEIMDISKKVAKMIHSKEDTFNIKKTGLEEGMVTLREGALNQLTAGMTTYEEVVRVTSEF